MNSKHILLALFGASLALGSCRQADIDLPTQDLLQPEELIAAENGLEALPNVIRVRFTTSEVERIEHLLQDQEGADIHSVALLEEMKAAHIERVFPHAGKYEERTRRAGLHLWYDITLEDEASAAELLAARSRALELADNSSTVTSTELVYVAKIPQTQVIRLDKSELRSLTLAAESPMNDPLLNKQWHYSNDGRLLGSEAGADINLFNAWRRETGKSNVIVSVVDGGVDVAHEDLKDNVYVNLAELNGQPGKDDDGNGYIDDINGYNFFLKQGAINANDHGTHVAGTVSARNNNGIGVCGVAGGNGELNSGVRIMSCQTFDVDPKDKKVKGNGFAQAIKYGADNGAVISQNSWGTPGVTTIAPSIREAIDYFIKNAGCDAEGNQLPDSPMKGGVLIFAAGNDGEDYEASPASYPRVISVSAMGPDFRVAPYSNRGKWVSIMAPGGNIYKHKGQILSTLPDNEYGYMQGASMACPHVSGIAALIVSKYGGQGFTAEELTKRIKTAVLPVDINEMNPEYAGRLGVGYIDAHAAVNDITSNVAPEAIRFESIKSAHTGLELSWQVAADADDEKAFGYNVYVDEAPLTSDRLAEVKKVSVVRPAAKVGEVIRHRLGGLKPKTQYYVAVEAYDRWGNVSAPLFGVQETLPNHNPVITVPEHPAIRLSGKDTYDLTLSVSDVDGHRWKYSLVGPTYGVTTERVGDDIKLYFRVVAQGKYSIKVLVTDELGGTAEQDIAFEVYQNIAPKQVKPFDKVYLPLGTAPMTLDLGAYFTDTNQDVLTYTVRTIGDGGAVVTPSIEGNTLTIKGVNTGRAAIEVVAKDPKGLEAKAFVEVEVVKDAIVHVIYPTPVSTTLNIRFASHLRQAKVRVFTPSGERALEKDITLSEGQPVAQLDVRSLSIGTYILHVEADGKEYRQSFIKR